MNWGRILAFTMAGENVIVALVYGYQGNVRMVVYWLAAAAIQGAVAW